MWNPDRAKELLEQFPGAEPWYARGKKVHPQYAYRFEIAGTEPKHISIDTRGPPGDQGLYLYVNAVSVNKTLFPKGKLGNVTVVRPYAKGYVAPKGQKGISAAAAQTPTLNPLQNDVYRLHVLDEMGFARLLDWYGGLASVSQTDSSPPSDPLEAKIEAAKASGNIEDERTLRAIKTRRGQSEFRRVLIDAYDGRCCITGCSIEAVLEAAHIVGHSSETNYAVNNGLLIRADIHTLFDLDLIQIDETFHILVAQTLERSEYQSLNGKRIALPSDTGKWPSVAALETRMRRNLFQL